MATYLDEDLVSIFASDVDEDESDGDFDSDDDMGDDMGDDTDGEE
jgi:hypothetical protein